MVACVADLAKCLFNDISELLRHNGRFALVRD
jgi:hypothetical protein